MRKFVVGAVLVIAMIGLYISLPRAVTAVTSPAQADEQAAPRVIEPEAGKVISNTLQAMEGLNSYHEYMSESLQGLTSQKSSLFQPGVNTEERDVTPISRRILVRSRTGETEIVFVGGKVYSRDSNIDGGKWGGGAKWGPVSNPMKDIINLSWGDLIAARIVGTDMVDGTETYHIKYSLVDLIPGKMTKGGDLWIGKTDYLLRRNISCIEPPSYFQVPSDPERETELNKNTRGVSSCRDTTFSMFNQPIDIEAPSPNTAPPVEQPSAAPPAPVPAGTATPSYATSVETGRILDTSGQVMLAMKSAHLSVEMTGPGVTIAGEGPVPGMSISATGEISGPQDYHFMITSGSVITESIGVGDKRYTRTPPDGQWKEGPNALPPGATSEPMTPSALLKAAGDQAAVDLAGSEVINGVDCYHLRATGNNSIIEMWIGKSDSYLRQAIITQQLPSSITGTPTAPNNRFEFHLSKFNEPVDIRPPS